MEKELFEILSEAYGETLPLELQSRVASKMQRQSFDKNEVILRPGEINRRLYFIQRGGLRAYSIENGAEITSWIRIETEFAVSISSFYPQAPSVEFIHAIEDTDVFTITYTELFEIYRKYLEFSFIGLILTIPVLVEWDQRLRILQTKDSAERFDWFMSHHAHLLERHPGIPAKYLASFLAMTPETFSKVRSKYFKDSPRPIKMERKVS